MNQTKAYVGVLIWLIALWFACSLLAQSGPMPPKIVMVKTNSATWMIKYSWIAATDATVKSYNVYWGFASDQYQWRTNVVGTSATIKVAATNCVYVAATTQNADGVQSPFSNEVTFDGWGERYSFAVQSASTVNGPWSDYAEFLAFTNAGALAQQFFRLRAPTQTQVPLP